MDQTSLSSVYLNLDALTSSSNEESLDVKKCEDFAVTIVCHSEGADTRATPRKSCQTRTRRTVRSDSRQEPAAPEVDLVTGKCKPGKVSRTVSTSPLTLDMTVMCTPEAEILHLGAAAQGVLPQDTVINTVAGFDTSTPAVATPVPVVGQPESQAKDFPTLGVLRLASVVRTVVLVFLVFLTHAAVGHSRGLVAFFFTQPGA